jgi:hypothetical protein
VFGLEETNPYKTIKLYPQDLPLQPLYDCAVYLIVLALSPITSLYPLQHLYRGA